MSNKYDVVIVGAGHNALIAAAYIARAGLSVAVLEEKEIPGGGVATGEHSLPGFRHDLASSFHIELQHNPLISVDELGLKSVHGLRYANPDPVVVIQPETETPLVQPRKLEDTVEAIGKYSLEDAQAYRRWISDWEEIRPAYIKQVASSPEAAVATDSAAAAKLARISAMSAKNLVEERFGHHRTQQLMYGNSIGNFVLPGTGLLPLMFAGFLSTSSWVVPIGGSASLVTALVAAIERRGGRVICNQLVNRILIENGRAAAVVTIDGKRYDARHAVISSAHVTQLAQLLGPGHLPAIFEQTLVNWRSSPSGFVIHLDVKGNPLFRTAEGPRPIVMGMLGDSEAAMRNLADANAGRLPSQRWISAFSFTSVDPSRAPEGHSTVKMFVYAPYALDGDPANWEGVREKFADELLATYASAVEGYEPGSELARTIVTPPELQQFNRSFIRGDFLGGEVIPNQAGSYRPVRGWAGYRMPVPGLYQLGASTHPAGGVNGWSGRITAKVLLDDLRIDSREFMAPAGEAETLPPVSA